MRDRERKMHNQIYHEREGGGTEGEKEIDRQTQEDIDRKTKRQIDRQIDTKKQIQKKAKQKRR